MRHTGIHDVIVPRREEEGMMGSVKSGAERAAVCAMSFALMLALTTAVARAQDATNDEAAIRALIEETRQANNAGDVERWVALFDDEAVYMAPGAPAVTTREDLIQVAEAGFRNRASIEIEPVEIHVSSEWAFARTEVSGSVKVAGTGEVVPVDVKQLIVYRRDPAAGEWRIARMISNSNTH